MCFQIAEVLVLSQTCQDTDAYVGDATDCGSIDDLIADQCSIFGPCMFNRIVSHFAECGCKTLSLVLRKANTLSRLTKADKEFIPITIQSRINSFQLARYSGRSGSTEPMERETPWSTMG